jgi:hypothetical protein
VGLKTIFLLIFLLLLLSLEILVASIAPIHVSSAFMLVDKVACIAAPIQKKKKINLITNDIVSNILNHASFC